MQWHMPRSELGADTGSLVGLDLAALGIPQRDAYVDAYVARTGLDPRRHRLLLRLQFLPACRDRARHCRPRARRHRDQRARRRAHRHGAAFGGTGLGIRPPGRGGMKSMALALGAGGARGLAHIAVLEALDELGIRPVAIAGSSIGALIGAAYAAGMSGRAIRRHVVALAHDRADMLRRVVGARAPGTGRFWMAPFTNPMLADGEKLASAFLPDAIPDDFAALAIPLTVVAADLYGRQPAVFASGPLKPPLAASMAVPGLVRPVIIAHHVLVDGGAVDPLPFGLLAGRADVIVAVDCSAGGAPSQRIPDPWECVFATITVMGQTIVAEKLKHVAPDLVLRPNVGRFRLLDFLVASAILRAAEPIKAEVKEKLGVLLAE